MHRKHINRRNEIEQLIAESAKELEAISRTFLLIEEFLKSNETSYAGQSEVTEEDLEELVEDCPDDEEEESK